MSDILDIRPSPIAGHWYSNNALRLKNEIEGFIQGAPEEQTQRDVVGIFVPHAGYRYSGKTAGYAFRQILGLSFDVVVVFAPFHSYSPADILTTAHGAYLTPLGAVQVAQGLVSSFLTAAQQQTKNKFAKIANDGEHSLEIELPFLQVALSKPFALLPLMVRTITPHSARHLAHILADYLQDSSVLLVASTDLSHFYPLEQAEQLDQAMLTAIQSFSSEAVFQTEQTGNGYACGLGAMLLALETAKLLGANIAKVLHHSTSAAETGDIRSVVGYGSGVFVRSSLTQAV